MKKIMKKLLSGKSGERSDLMEAILDKEAATNEYDKFHLFSRNKWILLMVLIFIITDGIFIYQLISEYSYQSQFQSVFCAATFAIIIDTIPTVMANLLKVPEKDKGHYIGIGALSAIVLAVFAVIFILRWNSQDVLYGVSNTQLSLLSDSLSGNTAEIGFTAGQCTMTILMGLEPIATSILAFCLGYFEHGRSDREYTKRIMNLRVKAELANVDANNLELQNEQSRNLVAYDSALKELEHDDLRHQEYITKEYIKMQLAMAQGTPEALSNMMEAERKEGDYGGSGAEGI